VRKNPIEAKQAGDDRKARERARVKSILDMADDFDTLWEYAPFKVFQEILLATLAQKTQEYEALKNISVDEILKQGMERYICRRTELEAEIRQLKNILEIQEKYRREADIISKKTQTPSPSAQNSGAGG